MPNVDYFLTTGPEHAQAMLHSALTTQNFSVQTLPDGSWDVTRGSKTATVWLGAWAGRQKQYMRFSALFFQHGPQYVVRLYRESGGGGMGGAVGVARSASVFTELEQAIGQTFVDAGALANVARA